MIVGSLARRYARALFEIGTAKGNYEQLGREIDALGAAYDGSRELQEALTNHIFAHAKRRSVLTALLDRLAASPVTRNFAALLFERDRIAYLPAIARELRVMVDDKAGRVRATITTVKPLDPMHASQIQQSLERALGRKVDLDRKQDPALIGGIVAKVGDLVYDGSVRTQLEQLRETIHFQD